MTCRNRIAIFSKIFIVHRFEIFTNRFNVEHDFVNSHHIARAKFVRVFVFELIIDLSLLKKLTKFTIVVSVCDDGIVC